MLDTLKIEAEDFLRYNPQVRNALAQVQLPAATRRSPAGTVAAVEAVRELCSVAWLASDHVLFRALREGSCVAVVESMMTNTPVGLLQDAEVGSKVFLTPQTRDIAPLRWRPNPGCYNAGDGAAMRDAYDDLAACGLQIGTVRP